MGPPPMIKEAMLQFRISSLEVQTDIPESCEAVIRLFLEASKDSTSSVFGAGYIADDTGDRDLLKIKFGISRRLLTWNLICNY